MRILRLSLINHWSVSGSVGQSSPGGPGIKVVGFHDMQSGNSFVCCCLSFVVVCCLSFINHWFCLLFVIVCSLSLFVVCPCSGKAPAPNYLIECIYQAHRKPTPTSPPSPSTGSCPQLVSGSSPESSPRSSPGLSPGSSLGSSPPSDCQEDEVTTSNSPSVLASIDKSS